MAVSPPEKAELVRSISKITLPVTEVKPNGTSSGGQRIQQGT